ncbi:hypothetical protein PMZ80_009058 [Knufia obscura]|uniref:Zn(2)-C6 fungal-type domain-containing protein n=1 Tax=Knufia obscura TaxID=1635080 RepID=A0ABR0RE08_9EURO|nr:hypothetical protein PMZ80_009058 [Knufia obscura]
MQQQDRQSRHHEQPRDLEAKNSLRLPSIVEGGISEGHGRSSVLSANSDTSMMPGFPEQHDFKSASPNQRSPLPGDYYSNSQSSGVGTHVDHLSPIMVNNSKRAYRQRRKDPSCDACRERKVKCDATETSSCTECSSRNVRCQFTKDTNRRMSSIKQVQDLERQLQETRAQLERLRAPEHFADLQAYYNPTSVEHDIPDVSRSPRRMLKARPPHDLSAARAQLSDVGRGILKPPIAPATPENPERRIPPLSSLPPREVAQHCLDSYFECVHRRISVLHWPHFCREFWSLYSGDTAPGITRETVALSFAVLGLGALFSQDPRVKDTSSVLISVSVSFMDFWVDSIGVDQALACLFVSIYLAETNKKSTSYVWLGSTIRVAQDRGLHVQGGHWSSLDGELRKRIWYSLYVWDRLMAIELGRPMLINDDDCDTEYPSPLEEEEGIADPFHPQKPTLLLASIHVARLLGPLAKLCRSLCITTEAIKKFEAHLINCIQLFPTELRPGADGPLDPLVVAPLIYFQNARILLHRHNMSPACSSEQRSTAIENCAIAAQDTANIISRCFQMATEDAEYRLKASATSLICTHLWRCMLFLAFKQCWSAFHVLLRYSALVNDSKPVNTSCGRHLDSFLHKLIQKHQHNRTQNLEEDEELVVLLSGDLEAGTNSWVWGSSETGTLLSRRQKHSRMAQGTQEVAQPARPSLRDMSTDSLASDEGMHQWGGWQRIHQAAQWLEEVQQGQQQHRLTRSSPEPQRSNVAADAEQYVSTARSRMTIASITDL